MVKLLDGSQNRVFSTTAPGEAGAKVYYYRTGTTTLVSLYTAADKLTPLSNPVVADANGFLPEVWYDDTFEVRRVSKTSADVTIEDVDPVPRQSAGQDTAASTSFTPVDGNSATDVQEAIANVQAEVISTGRRYCTVAGTANALTLTSSAGEPYDATPTGVVLTFVPATSNTGAATINLDGLGAVSAVTVTGAAMPAGYLRTGVVTTALFNGTSWIVSRAEEVGSNANGVFFRKASGELLCYFRLSVASAGAATVWTFPATDYAAAPIVVGTVEGSTTAARFVNTDGLISTTNVGLVTFDATGTRQTAAANVAAIGRWY